MALGILSFSFLRDTQLATVFLVIFIRNSGGMEGEPDTAA
jgi:hypothetical protein